MCSLQAVLAEYPSDRFNVAVNKFYLMNSYELKRLQAMHELRIASQSWFGKDGHVYVPEINAHDNGVESPYVPEVTFNFRPYTKRIIKPH